VPLDYSPTAIFPFYQPPPFAQPAAFPCQPNGRFWAFFFPAQFYNAAFNSHVSLVRRVLLPLRTKQETCETDRAKGLSNGSSSAFLRCTQGPRFHPSSVAGDALRALNSLHRRATDGNSGLKSEANRPNTYMVHLRSQYLYYSHKSTCFHLSHQ